MHIMTGLLGAAVGMAIAAVIWAVVVSLRKKRSGDAPQFDERQLAARAKAYSSACQGIQQRVFHAARVSRRRGAARFGRRGALGCTLDALFWPEADS